MLGTWTLVRSPPDSPEAALADFYSGGKGFFFDEFRPECMQADPLIKAGAAVVPLVIAALPDRSMPRRVYAIGFLGMGRYLIALPALESIFSDPSKLDYFRAGALSAIYGIEPDRARMLAADVSNTTKHLDRTVQAVLRGDDAFLKVVRDKDNCG